MNRASQKLEEVLEAAGAGLVGGFLIGAVVGGVLVAILGFTLSAAHVFGHGHRQPAAFSEVSEPTAGDLADRFRPWLAFDSGELWRPLNVQAVFNEGTHDFCTRVSGGDQCSNRSRIADFQAFNTDVAHSGAAGVNTYVNLKGGSVLDYHGPEHCPKPLLDCASHGNSAIYYHVTQSNDRYYIDYWWFLRFNHFSRSGPAVSCKSQALEKQQVCDEHEGDWEGVTVVTPPDDSSSIDYVVYAAHKGTFRYASSELQFPKGDSDHHHPIVFSAQGSHASYARACAGDCKEPPELAFQGLVDLPEGRFNGNAAWGLDKASCPAGEPGSCLQPLAGQQWTKWPGQWGAGCGDACGNNVDANSPQAPGVQARYQTPWCSTQNGVITCDGKTLTCSDWLGPLVVAVACDPDKLAKAATATNAVSTGKLKLTVGGQDQSTESSPGVVQALGDPLRTTGETRTLTVTPDGSSTQILVRAEQGDVVVEDRFADKSFTSGGTVHVTVSQNTASPEDGPTVLANGLRPVERKILVTPPVATAAGG